MSFVVAPGSSGGNGGNGGVVSSINVPGPTTPRHIPNPPLNSIPSTPSPFPTTAPFPNHHPRRNNAPSLRLPNQLQPHLHSIPSTPTSTTPTSTPGVLGRLGPKSSGPLEPIGGTGAGRAQSSFEGVFKALPSSSGGGSGCGRCGGWCGRGRCLVAADEALTYEARIYDLTNSQPTNS